ncbi:MAG: CRTAC1 family protein [Acidobacteriota bacterium]|nr:CRTAC1 family protein [Acidobacteriota bacterium]
MGAISGTRVVVGTIALLLSSVVANGQSIGPEASQSDGPDGESPAWFSDRAEAVGLDFVHFNGMSGEFYSAEVLAPGGALFDFDNDGDLDVYIVQGQMLGPGKTMDMARMPPGEAMLPLTDRLYRNDLEIRSDGTRSLRFTDVTASSGLGVQSYGMGVTTGDVDNDGWVDLYRTGLRDNHLFHNNGDGTFLDVTEETGTNDIRWSVSASFLDIDRDGWLDLFVGNYVNPRLEDALECRNRTGERDYCGPKRYVAVSDRLYRNRGDGTFVDVTVEALSGGEYGPALGVVATDVDSDGWVDIYVANDGEPNQLWMNQRDGRFANDAWLAGAAVNRDGRAEGSMGVDAADFDGDGDDDLFMTHISTETNTLYINDGSGLFEDRTARVGLGPPSLTYTAFGTVFFDYDNDGWLDLLIANGEIMTQETLVRVNDPFPLHQPNQLFRNLGSGRFTEVTGEAGGVFRLSVFSRGVAVGDIDNDGDADVLLTNNNGRTRLLVNGLGHRNQWVGLRLVGGPGGRDMLGARVGVVRADGSVLWGRARADGTYASANDPRVLMGLGQTQAIDRVRVIWPSGQLEEWTDVDPGQWTTLTEGTGKPVE